MKEKSAFGFVASKLDGTEYQYEYVPNMNIPKKYNYVNFLPRVFDQKETNTCVPQSVSAHLNWNKNVDTDGDNKRDNHIKINEIYSARKTPGDNGMSFKEAMSFLLHKGVSSDLGRIKIEMYAKVNTSEELKQALLLNGPCVGALMVYNMGPEFWNREQYEKDYGGHAISIVGWTEQGFIIRNSWGENWAL